LLDQPTYDSLIDGIIGPGLFVEMGVLLTYCMGWPWIQIFMIST
jgi:hypothetical protein